MPRNIRPIPLLTVPAVVGGMLPSSLACSSIPFPAHTAAPTAAATGAPTVTRTATPILTPTATRTSTRTATPPTPFLEWPLVCSESFEGEYTRWSTGDVDGEYMKGSFSISGGKYVIRFTAGQPFFHWLDPDIGSFYNFFLSVEGKKNSGPSNAVFGLFFRKTAVNYYFFAVAPDLRKYLISIRENNEWNDLVEWTHSSRIETGAANRIGVLAEGTRLRFFINGREVDVAEDDTPSRGEAGLGFAVFDASDTADLEIDNYEVREPRGYPASHDRRIPDPGRPRSPTRANRGTVRAPRILCMVQDEGEADKPKAVFHFANFGFSSGSSRTRCFFPDYRI
jgi:hypothetical protein